MDDFLVLPFLRLSSLGLAPSGVSAVTPPPADDMHITSSDDKRTISLAVQALQDCLPGDRTCIGILDFESHEVMFGAGISVRTFLCLSA